MTFYAVLRVLEIERLLAVVTLVAEIILGYFCHIHFIGPLFLHEHGIVTTVAFETLHVYMLFMAEDNLAHPYGLEGQISAAGNGKQAARRGQIKQKRNNRYQGCSHKNLPLSNVVRGL
jgi:hypothetical protein